MHLRRRTCQNFEQYEILAKEMLKREKEGRPFTFYHYMIDLEHGPCIYKRVSGCGSGTEYMAVTPWGELFPCHQFVGDPKYSLGDVWNGVKNKEIQDKFRKCNVLQDENVTTAGQDCIAAVAVRQTRITQQAILRGFINMVASCLKSELNVPLC